MEFDDALLYGHDPTPGIVSVYADHSGQAWVWRRAGQQVHFSKERFRPWVFARDLQDVSTVELSHDDPAAPFHVAELPGEPGSLKFLITARDGYALRRVIFQNASRRLGSPVTGFHDLRGYVSAGPIEQYLTATGRTYFKGMSFDDPVRLQFDLETTALTPEEGRIFMIAVRDNRGFEKVLEARRPAQEADLIAELMQFIHERDPDIIENHNISAFDLPFLMGRARTLRVPLELGRPGGPVGIWRVQDGRTSPHWAVSGREILDTIDAVRRMDLPSAGLKVVSQLFGIAPPDRVYLEGERIAETYRDHPALVRQYALQDVEEVDHLARRVLSASFELAKMTPRPYHRLPYAGPAMGVLEPMLIRAYFHAKHALPPEQPHHAEPHSGGHVELFAEGVLQRVVKADVASLYPSVIRAERIEPRSDPLHVFLHLMDHLTARRLQHKAAMRRGETGEHRAMQSAMKLIINSGYGYLGAGRMAIFGDRDAADRVTTKGREILSNVVDDLRAGGVTLIEADTDGVYFSVPGGWTEAQERELIQQVDADLPEGISLEFDGRWQAMLSHEIKNYALLGYDGQLTVRGASFDTVRTESFARDFMQRALPCLLQGDIAALQDAFHFTLDALQQRRLTNREVATRVRLTKPPEQYREARRKENQYEAMLKAGATWRAGQRVYQYQQQEQGWLPLEVNPEGRDYDVQAYIRTLMSSYVTRLRKGLNPEDYQQVFQPVQAQGLFDRQVVEMRPVWRPVV
ncbi:DNA polymerase domain-containing protein [Deinococcus cavernae]|uniref:DNA polymerase domain-containing protein n=1 Tax=Deinococcus cavernae TaxID=2320857 RepID=UPI0018F5603E|nr:DNA polymerase domain-containing protein [Deinococcus cavernae]